MIAEVVPSDNWLDWAMFAVTILAPFVALGGAVWLFFLKSKSEREDEARKVRRELYRAFISQSEQVLRVPKDEKWAEDDRMRVFWSMQAEIALIATDPVIDASAGFVVSTNDFFMSDEQKIMGRDGELRTKFENASYWRNIAIDAMRKELRD